MNTAAELHCGIISISNSSSYTVRAGAMSLYGCRTHAGQLASCYSFWPDQPAAVRVRAVRGGSGDDAARLLYHSGTDGGQNLPDLIILSTPLPPPPPPQRWQHSCVPRKNVWSAALQTEWDSIADRRRSSKCQTFWRLYDSFRQPDRLVGGQYWPLRYTTVRPYVQQCHACSRRRRRNALTAGNNN